MAVGDGNGWVVDESGQKYWGRFGAAGLLLRAPGMRGRTVLMQHRAWWSHQGGTWSIPGGAIDSHESPTQGALREAAEEVGIDPADVDVKDVIVTAAAATWTYTTVVADAATQFEVFPNNESVELRWVSIDDVDTLPLHPAFAQAWSTLKGL